MIGLQLAILLLVMCAGTGVVLTRKPQSQVIGVSVFGLNLALMFFLFQAPDVALSQIVIGAVGLPLMILLALAKVEKDNRERKQHEDEKNALHDQPDEQEPPAQKRAP